MKRFFAQYTAMSSFSMRTSNMIAQYCFIPEHSLTTRTTESLIVMVTFHMKSENSFMFDPVNFYYIKILILLIIRCSSSIITKNRKYRIEIWVVELLNVQS